MLEAVEHAQSYVAGLTVETFTADSKSIHAVERCLEIISEASRDIPPDVKLQHPNTPWKQMADAGNFYRHVYDAVDPKLVWRVVQDDLPELKRVLLAVRNAIGNAL